MKQYLELMRDIVDNGVNCPDRTGTGRRRVFGRQIRFDVSGNKLPLVTTRKIFTAGVIHELLWFIRGESNTTALEELGVNIWKDWKVTPESVKAWMKERNLLPADATDDFIEELVKNNFSAAIGEVGGIYGPNWRRWQRNMTRWHHVNAPTTHLVRSVASDHLKQFEPEYDNYKVQIEQIVEMQKLVPEDQRQGNIPDPISFEQFADEMSKTYVDQFNELIEGLKKRPYSARHVVTSWNPDMVPNEDVSPETNVLDGFGALAACHVLQQYFALPPAVEGGKPRLSLMMTQRSADWPVGSPFNIAQYSLLLMLVAHCVGMEPHEFIYSIGDTHIYTDQLPLVEEQMSREPRQSPVVRINPELTDIFQTKFEDITIEGYDPHPVIKYPVSK